MRILHHNVQEDRWLLVTASEQNLMDVMMVHRLVYLMAYWTVYPLDDLRDAHWVSRRVSSRAYG